MIPDNSDIDFLMDICEGQDLPIAVWGRGSDATDIKVLQGRAKRKTITQRIMLHLINLATELGDFEMVDSYCNTYDCQNKLISANDRIYGNTCKNRFCTLCLSIRKAIIINKYYPVLKTWETPYFVTLTLRSVPADRLEKRIKDVRKSFYLIKEICKQRHKRGKGVKIMGIRSLECNFNSVDRTYNPHFHLIVPNQETALTIQQQWYIKWKDQVNLWDGIDIRKVKSLERDLIETIKYGSKVFTEPDKVKRGKNKIPPKIYLAAFHNIQSAMKGRRQFDRFGFNLPKSALSNTSKSGPTLLYNFEEWNFDPELCDWINSNTGEVLTGYIPSAQLIYLLENNIDTTKD